MGGSSFSKMARKITLFNKENRKFFELNRLNLIFGPSFSGKTTCLDDFASIFSGKKSKYEIDGTAIVPDEWNLITIRSDDGISTQLKMSPKSLLRSTIKEEISGEHWDDEIEKLENSVSSIQNRLADLLLPLLPSATVSFGAKGKVSDLILDNVTVSLNDTSSSLEKEAMLKLVVKLFNDHGNSVVLIDDFADKLDEEQATAIMEEMKAGKATFIVASRHPLPQSIWDDEITVMASKDGRLIQIQPLSKLLKRPKEGKTITFEEYMIGNGYDSLITEERLLKEVQNDGGNSLFRLLCLKRPKEAIHTISRLIPPYVIENILGALSS